MFQRLLDFHNKYKAELVVISMVDGVNSSFYRDKPRPLSATKKRMKRMNHIKSSE